MSNTTLEQQAATLVEAGKPQAAKALLATAAKSQNRSTTREVTGLSEVRGRVQEQPQTQLPFEARELELTAVQVTEDVNPNSGSLRLDIKFSCEQMSRPVFVSVSIAGQNLKAIDRLVCKFTGKLFTDMKDHAPSDGEYADAVKAILSSSIRAFVFQDKSGFLTAPIMGTQGRILWNKVS